MINREGEFILFKVFSLFITMSIETHKERAIIDDDSSSLRRKAEVLVEVKGEYAVSNDSIVQEAKIGTDIDHFREGLAGIKARDKIIKDSVNI